MKLNQEYFLINGLMFLIVFGSIILSIKIEKRFLKLNYEYILYNAKLDRTFVRIERIQNKSFFGYNHYYFTLSFWYKGKPKSLVKKVNSTLYYKYKEGSEVEAIIVIDLWNTPKIFLIPQILEEASLEETKYINIERMSNTFFILGVIMIFFYFMIRMIHKKRIHAKK